MTQHVWWNDMVTGVEHQRLIWQLESLLLLYICALMSVFVCVRVRIILCVCVCECADADKLIQIHMNTHDLPYWRKRCTLSSRLSCNDQHRPVKSDKLTKLTCSVFTTVLLCKEPVNGFQYKQSAYSHPDKYNLPVWTAYLLQVPYSFDQAVTWNCITKHRG